LSPELPQWLVLWESGWLLHPVCRTSSGC